MSKMVDCPACNGSGMNSRGSDCGECKGHGKIEKHVIASAPRTGNYFRGALVKPKETKGNTK